MTEKTPHRASPEIKPCRHMEQWVHALADDSLTGFARWYTRLHVGGCRRCYAALEALQSLRERLKALRATDGLAAPPTLPLERREALRAALDAVEKRTLP